VSNRTETKTLAMEFDAVLSGQRRFGLSTLYRSTPRESGATIAGPCQSESALEGACRLLNTEGNETTDAEFSIAHSPGLLP
jgi:hypothetical protein